MRDKLMDLYVDMAFATWELLAACCDFGSLHPCGLLARLGLWYYLELNVFLAASPGGLRVRRAGLPLCVPGAAGLDVPTIGGGPSAEGLRLPRWAGEKQGAGARLEAALVPRACVACAA